MHYPWTLPQSMAMGMRLVQCHGRWLGMVLAEGRGSGPDQGGENGEWGWVKGD